MKKILVLLFPIVVFAAAITEKKSINIIWDQGDAPMPVNVYTNGIFWRAFPTNQIISFVDTNGVASLKVITTAPARGTYQFTVTQFDGQFESDPSNVITQSFKVLPPQNLRFTEK
jgi:hypothetical protein